MIRLSVIKHSVLSDADLNLIIQLKSVAWNYSLDKQKIWINDNIKEDDFHIILYIQNQAVAYLNLIDTTFVINDNTYLTYGIGNVCAKEKCKGYGKLLISLVNKFIVENNRIGVLLCKNELIQFYTKAEWLLIDNSIIFSTVDLTNIRMMIYNVDFKVNKVEYKGRIF